MSFEPKPLSAEEERDMRIDLGDRSEKPDHPPKCQCEECREADDARDMLRVFASLDQVRADAGGGHLKHELGVDGYGLVYELATQCVKVTLPGGAFLPLPISVRSVEPQMLPGGRTRGYVLELSAYVPAAAVRS